jgi:hypothetical protein
MGHASWHAEQRKPYFRANAGRAWALLTEPHRKAANSKRPARFLREEVIQSS